LDGGVINFIGSFKSVFVAALTIKGYPGFINNIDTEKILNVDGSFTLIQVYKFLNPSNAKNLVMKAEQIYRSQIKSPVVQMFEKISGSESNKINKGNLVLADDCQSALIEMTAEEIDFGYHSMSILVVEESLECLSDTQKKISEILINSGYGVIKEVMYQMGAFLTSIPGVMNGIIRSTLISSRNLSNLIILRSVNSGSEINTHLSEQRKIKTPYLCLLPTHTNVPEKFNFHVGDVGHFMVVGPSGSGKTTLMNFLMIHWLQYSPCRVFVIDKDKSCYLTLRALGGSYISLNSGSTGSLSINPLLNYRTSSAQFKLESWIVGIMESRSASNISARELLAIRSALNMLSMSSSVMTLTKLKQMLEGLNSDLASRLSPWVKSDFNFDHSLNHIFDNEKDDFFEAIKDQKNGVIGIDFSGFNNDSGLMAAILEYLFNCIDEVVDGKIPTLIYLEEAWYLLQNDRFRKGFEDWIKTMRKKLAIVGISTQSVNDILNSGISTSLNDNIKTRIYLSNSQINSSRHVYKNILGIDDEYIEIIKGLKPKSEYFICQENKYRIVNLKLTENILAFTRSDRVAIDAFDDFLLSNNLHQYKKYLSNLQRVAYAN
jgi:type IV secretion system protein VirB4